PVLGTIFCQAKKDQLEHCGFVHSKAGGFFVDVPQTGTNDKCEEKDTPYTAVGFYHNHPKGQGVGFSPDDIKESDIKLALTFYLVGEEGDLLRRGPNGQQVTNLGKAPGCP